MSKSEPSPADKPSEAESLRNAANALVSAAQMLDHNDAIFKGKWKKGSKAWGGDFIERTIAEGLAHLGRTPPSAAAPTFARNAIYCDRSDCREAEACQRVGGCALTAPVSASEPMMPVAEVRKLLCERCRAGYPFYGDTFNQHIVPSYSGDTYLNCRATEQFRRMNIGPVGPSTTNNGEPA